MAEGGYAALVIRQLLLNLGVIPQRTSTLAQILIPTSSVEDWKRLLAQPDLHWKAGYSAMTLARSWEHAAPRGFPPEVAASLGTGSSEWKDLRLLVAIPEYRVALPGGSRASQTDLVAVARSASGLVVIAVEGKVDESFGPTVAQKRAEESSGVDERLAYLEATLGLSSPCPGSVRYQLLHRTVSALRVAHDFAAPSAVMLVQSFSATGKCHEDFEAFARLFGPPPVKGTLAQIGVPGGTALYIGWCVGDQRFRAGVEVPVV